MKAHRHLPHLLVAVTLPLCSPLHSGESDAPVTTRTDAAGVLVNRWFAEGKAAGHKGDFYDNRDSGHSSLDLAKYPQLRPLPYTDSEKAAKKNYGPAAEIRPETVIGNASLSGTAVGGASIPRLLYSTREGLGFLTTQYLSNQLYLYPEHQDHDPRVSPGDGWGDLFPLNSPYLLASQGSSGSDLAFLDAIAMTLASFPPEVKELLRGQKILMPVVQQIFRRSLKILHNREDYLAAPAHPSVFSSEWIDEEKMMRFAQAMTPQSLPPIFHLEVVKETPSPRPGIDFFESTERESESLADRGMSIARVFRGMEKERGLTVRVGGIRNPSGLPLQIHWRILRGDGDTVSIERSDSAPEATIRVKWTDPGWQVPGGPAGLLTRRVEIGVFADNGESYSPPCFVSFYFLPNERRTYDMKGRILEADYRFPGAFTDVTLTSTKPWRDRYHYEDSSGKLVGWTRDEEGKAPADFDAEGRLLRDGKALRVEYETDTTTHHLHQTPIP